MYIFSLFLGIIVHILLEIEIYISVSDPHITRSSVDIENCIIEQREAMFTFCRGIHSETSILFKIICLYSGRHGLVINHCAS